tara:strand:+ start:3891 stop:4136 length:246 start_codon:yes stop_codon:yes gene_type:complete
MSKYSNRKWVIITLASYTDEQLQEMVDNTIQTSVDTLRKNNDNTKAILKYEGNKPTCLYGMTAYTHGQILIELAKSEWTSE